MLLAKGRCNDADADLPKSEFSPLFAFVIQWLTGLSIIARQKRRRSNTPGSTNVTTNPHVPAVTPEMLWKLTSTSVENALVALQGEIPNT